MIEILKAGLYTTIQDQGRSGYAHLGVPIGGAMDRMSADYANALLSNDLYDSFLECTVIGPKILFHKNTMIAITGAVIQPFINNEPTYINAVITIKKGDVLTFGRIVKGARFYIGISGGFKHDAVFNSQSACLTSNILGIIKKGDQIHHAEVKKERGKIITKIRNIGSKDIRVRKGPEYNMLESSDIDVRDFFDLDLKVRPESNRMAYRVSHNLELKHQQSIISSATLPGTVQLTPNGDLIFLMRDAQTTGGYPRVFQLDEEGICDLSQIKTGEVFRIHLDK